MKNVIIKEDYSGAHSIILNERDLLRFKIISGGFMKSIPCAMVLRLMDTEEFGCDYCRALGLVLKLFPEIDRVELEKELDKYV